MPTRFRTRTARNGSNKPFSTRKRAETAYELRKSGVGDHGEPADHDVVDGGFPEGKEGRASSRSVIDVSGRLCPAARSRVRSAGSPPRGPDPAACVHPIRSRSRIAASLRRASAANHSRERGGGRRTWRITELSQARGCHELLTGIRRMPVPRAVVRRQAEGRRFRRRPSAEIVR